MLTLLNSKKRFRQMVWISSSAACCILLTANAYGYGNHVSSSLKISNDQETITISGTVKNQETNQPIAGVTVSIAGTSIVTSTNSSGFYELKNVPKNATINFSLIGMQSISETINGRTSIHVSLSENSEAIDEVVVVGYGTQKKKDVTGAVSTLKSSDYKDQPVTTASSALQGRVPGVAVNTASGNPGADVKIRIRGANSINTNNDPLYVVDGIALGTMGLNQLNPSDIESMDILKDASATAVYGSRGANGVVIITTKKGKSGESKINYDGFISSNTPIKKYKLMDAVTYANYANKLRGSLIYPNPESFANKTTDWQDLIINKNALTQNHQISASGGSDNVKYFTSGFIIDQKGTLINTSQKSYGLRTNIDVKLNKKLSLGMNLFLQRTEAHNNKDNGSKSNPLVSSLFYDPTEPVYDNEALGLYNTDVKSPVSFNSNPYMVLRERLNDEKSNIGLLNGSLTYSITKDLKLTVNAGLDLNLSKNLYLNNNWISPGNMGSGQNTSENYTIQNSNILNYTKTFNNVHDLNVTAVFESTKNTNSQIYAGGTGLTSLINGYYDINLNTSQGIGSPYSQWAMMSYLGRVAYGFDNKYFVTASIRRDGSSKFGNNNKWGTFPSVSLGWNVLKESFMEGQNLFSALKVRGGWGVTGNDRIPPYSTLGLLKGTIFAYGSNESSPSYALGNPPTPDVKWETSKQSNIGIDFSVLNNRLSLTADYYNKNTTGLLLYTRIRNFDGGGQFLKNIGKTNNRGVELVLSGVPVKKENFSWESNFSFSINKNKVLDLGGDDLLETSEFAPGFIRSIQVIKVGEPLGTFYLIPWLGIHQVDDNNLGAKAGDNKYQDTDGKKSIGLEDRVINGSATPTHQLGFNNTFSYKSLSLNVMIQGSYGNKVFNATYGGLAIPTSDVPFPALAEVSNYWTPTNTSAVWSTPGSVTNKYFMESDQFLQSGNFTRLKNLSLSYRLPKTLIKGISAASVTLSAQNLATLTNYKGYDPEISSTSASSDTQSGIDLGAYPTSKSYTLRLNLTF